MSSAITMMPVPIIVVDSSVSLKWVLNDEEAVTEAVALRDDGLAGRIQWIVPDLWHYELTNGLITAVRRRRISEAQAMMGLMNIMALALPTAVPRAADVYQKAIQYTIAAYDAAYLALAEMLDAIVWTGDHRFYTAVRSQTARVHWIGDYLVSRPDAGKGEL
ncbi:MAG: type II toxin-antitoxin system VapC family toxin [Herpetosiphonaceae bacterium]|nr:type II toxin-antitoxin system VapC family toxin [Herpetosiphonaceae bacterium]